MVTYSNRKIIEWLDILNNEEIKVTIFDELVHLKLKEKLYELMELRQ